MAEKKGKTDKPKIPTVRVRMSPDVKQEMLTEFGLQITCSALFLKNLGDGTYELILKAES
jgi:hypothetical protein